MPCKSFIMFHSSLWSMTSRIAKTNWCQWQIMWVTCRVKMVAITFKISRNDKFQRLYVNNIIPFTVLFKQTITVLYVFIVLVNSPPLKGINLIHIIKSYVRQLNWGYIFFKRDYIFFKSRTNITYVFFLLFPLGWYFYKALCTNH